MVKVFTFPSQDSVERMSPQALDVLYRISAEHGHEHAMAEEEGRVFSSRDLALNALTVYKAAENLLAETGTTDQTVIDEVADIAVSNRLAGKDITEPLGQDVTSIGGKYSKQAQLIRIYGRDPETARMLAANRISGFHGSSSGSLLSVLKHGLLPAKEARAHPDIDLTSGERYVPHEEGQSTISFADWRNPTSIRAYADMDSQPYTLRSMRKEVRRVVEIAGLDKHRNDHGLQQRAEDAKATLEKVKRNHDPLEAELILSNFPVAYGISAADFIGNELAKEPDTLPDILRTVESDIDGEFMVTRPISPQHIKVIAVPEIHVPKVKSIVDQFGGDVDVIALETLLEGSQTPPRAPWNDIEWFA